MTEQGMRFRIGLFVLSALVLLAVLVTLFGSFPALFKHRHEYTVTFSDAPGIGAGTPVRRSGVRIGEVKDIDLDNDTGEVRVHLLIERNYTLRRNEEPTLVQGLLGSDASIDLVPCHTRGGAQDSEAVPPGTVLAGVRQANMSTLLSKASEVMPSTQETMNQIRQSLQRFEKMAPLMEETVREYRDLARATREAVPELRRTNDEVRELARAAHEVVPGIGRTSDEVRELVKAAHDTVPSLNQTSAEVRELAAAVRATVPELRRTNEEIGVTAHNWGQLGQHVDGLLQANQERLVHTVDGLNETLTRISGLFNEENQRNLTVMLHNVRTGTEALESITRNTDDLLKESRQTVHKVGDSVARADDAMGNLQQATKPLADRSSSVMKNLDESTAKLNQTMTELQDLLHVVEQSDGTLRRVVADPSLYNHLDQAACNLDHLLPHLERILHDLEVFSDKIARHPEALGIGGVVSPSSGLK